MKYTIESTGHICVETIELSDGSIYQKTHIKTDSGSICKEKSFDMQMWIDGICSEIREIVSDVFDGTLVSDCFKLSEMED
ncbi:MAG: hypothetical protein ACLRPH_00585 [Ruminococcus sp.]